MTDILTFYRLDRRHTGTEFCYRRWLLSLDRFLAGSAERRSEVSIGAIIFFLYIEMEIVFSLAAADPSSELRLDTESM